MRRSLILLLVLLVPSAASAAEPGGSSQNLPLGPEDLLQIHVFEFPELNLKVRISEDGAIGLPLLGQVQAAGLTVPDLQGRLETLLEERYLKEPQVSIFVEEQGSRRVSILGEVAHPGSYQLLGSRTVLQVLSEAGGLTDDAGDRLLILRGQPGKVRTSIPIELSALMLGKSPELDIPIEPGDTITVPRDELIHVFVDGAVRTPGRLEQKASRPMTLLQALSRAGGPTDRANLKSVKVLRQDPDGAMREAYDINVKKARKGGDANPVLQDGDVVVVPEALF